ncbi:hypothetical protein [Streptomyces avidinii]|uniref:Formate/nitrite transporter FocA (FNT family) n=1 Tax=Streptomyces avidinii TaxID=1895 RepID=A0ABS4L450_STRAV|nr:hypothetical protein [Streptomyces avidinii]MBP2036871.1 formate/nitrite transporter FocA (FNT family) [Streptomyces avidinii]GGY93534.1 hypothetical protein GCM10010343_18440 [Streptomyces avidinii]
MRSTRTAKTANTKTAAACLVVLAGVFVGTGGTSAVMTDTRVTTQADDMPWGIVTPVVPPHPGTAGTNGDMPWG